MRLRSCVFGNKSESIRRSLEAKRDVMIHFYGENWRGKFVHHPETLDQTVIKHSVEDDQHVMDASASITAALIGSDSKDVERCIITMHGGNREVYAEAIPEVGEVRGFVRAGVRENLPSVIMMNRILYKHSEPVYSAVEGREMTELFWRGGMASKLWKGGGMVLEAAPDSVNKIAPDISAREKLQQRLDNIPAFLEGDHLPSDYIKQHLPDTLEHSLRRVWVAFHCRCSKDMFLKQLRVFDKSMIVDMRDKQQNELSCHFCSKVHQLDEMDFATLIESKD